RRDRQMALARKGFQRQGHQPRAGPLIQVERETCCTQSVPDSAGDHCVMSVLHTPLKTVRFADGSLGEALKGVGVASYCQCAADHTPKPLRFVWHHILPVTCGGKSVPANLVMACDNCHYAIHSLMTA